MRKTPVLAVAAIKGGTGKTATAGALAFAAHHANKKVLAIDMDPQCNLTMWLDGDPTLPGIYDAMTGIEEEIDIVQHTDCGVDILAGSAALSTLSTRAGSASRLKKVLEPLKGKYELLIIDNGPTISESLNNSLMAATHLLIPLYADSFSLQGLYQLADMVDTINPSITYLGVVLTNFDSRPRITRFCRDTIEETAKQLNIPYLGEIRKGIALPEAMATCSDLFIYAPKSKPAEDYLTLYHKLSFKNKKG